jgi:hypothetical protein
MKRVLVYRAGSRVVALDSDSLESTSAVVGEQEDFRGAAERLAREIVGGAVELDPAAECAVYAAAEPRGEARAYFIDLALEKFAFKVYRDSALTDYLEFGEVGFSEVAVVECGASARVARLIVRPDRSVLKAAFKALAEAPAIGYEAEIGRRRFWTPGAELTLTISRVGIRGEASVGAQKTVFLTAE